MELKEQIKQAKYQLYPRTVPGYYFTESELTDLLETAIRDAVGEYAVNVCENMDKISKGQDVKYKPAGAWIDDYFTSLNLFD